MRKMRKSFALLLVITLALGLCTFNAYAASTEKIVCFTNCSMGFTEVAATMEAPGYRLYSAIIDGEQKQVKVLRTNSWFTADHPFNTGYNAWAGPALCTFNDAGYITSTKPVDNLISGYSTNAPDIANSTITLGVKAITYRYASDVQVYVYSNDLPITDYKIDISKVTLDNYSEYDLLLNKDGAIQTMYISKGFMQGAYPLFNTVQQFNSAVGPTDSATGYATEYLSYTPQTKSNEKYPLLIWLHGAYCGQNTWSTPFNFNDFAKFATPEYQSQFTAGGAYIMAPNAHEVKGENGRVWNESQVQAVYNAIDDFIAKNPNVDSTRIYIGGFSMGGGMTWAMVNARPDFFAAAFPNCAAPWLMPSISELNTVASLPMWIIHGYYDPVVPVVTTMNYEPIMKANAKATNTDTRFTILDHVIMPDGKTPVPNEHLVWVSTLNNMLFDDGSKYVDRYGVPVQSTLIDWLNQQNTVANAARAEEAVYTDVNAGDWYYNYIMDLSKDDMIISGLGGNTFAPTNSASYGQALKMIMLAAGYPEQKATGTHWASGYMAKALADGLISKSVNLNEAIDRVTVAKIAAKSLKLSTDLKASPFTDTADTSVLALYHAGIISGCNGVFSPYNAMTRAELCAITWRIIHRQA